MIPELDPELKDLRKQWQPKSEKIITTASPQKSSRKNRNHFTAGDTGFIPQSVGQNPYKMRK